LAITTNGGLHRNEQDQRKQQRTNSRKRRGITTLQLAQHYQVDHISARSLPQLQQQQNARHHYFRTITQQHLPWGPKTMGTKNPGDQNHHRVHHHHHIQQGNCQQHGNSQPESHGNRHPVKHGNRELESHGNHRHFQNHGNQYLAENHGNCLQTITGINRAQLEARVEMLNCI
jgi:hypothetical protein